MAGRVEHSLLKALRGVPEFALVDEDALLGVVGASVNLFWPAGSVVFRQGEPSDGLYIVLSGSVSVSDENGMAVGEVGPGDYFGEQSLLLESTRARTVTAAEDSEFMIVPREEFQRLLESSPDLAVQVREKLRARTGSTGGG